MVIWYLISNQKNKLHVYLFGDSQNPYVKELISGVSKQCDQAKYTLQLFLFEDIATNKRLYHKALSECPSNTLICRVIDQDTLETLKKAGKKAIVIASETKKDLLMNYPDVVIQSFHSETPQFSVNSVIIVPSSDFPPINTDGAVIAASNISEPILEQLLSLSHKYYLTELFIYNGIPGFADELVQAALHGVFQRIQVLPVMGSSEGKAAVNAMASYM